MTRKSALVLVLVGLMAVPPASSASLATLTGLVTSAAGKPASGVELDLVNLDTGHVVTVRTDGSGAYRAQLDPGPYTVSARQGYSVARGPRLVTLAADQFFTADLALAGLRDDAQAPNTDTNTENEKKRRGAAWWGAASVVGGATLFALLVHTPTSPSR